MTIPHCAGERQVSRVANGRSVSYLRPNYPPVNSDTEPPAISDIKVSEVSTSGYSISARVTDNTGVSKVRFPTWTVDNDQDDVIWADGDYDGEYAHFKVKTSDHNNELGWYRTHIYAYDNAGNQSSVPVQDILLENKKPVITEVEVIDISKTEYTVRAKVVDTGSGIDRVQFPTWTLENGQDDLISTWGTSKSVRGTFDGDYVTFKVKISDHNKELGTYRTHIYAYDKCGNTATAKVPDVIIENETPKISDVEVVDITPDSYTVKCKVKDDGCGIDRVQFPTWTLKDGQDDLISTWGSSKSARGTIKDDTVTFTVNRKDHNNEIGEYRTHIYAYDKCGNTAMVKVPDVLIPDYGDINMDGEVNGKDIEALAQFLTTQVDTLACWKAGDINKDGKLNAVDLSLLINISKKKG